MRHLPDTGLLSLVPAGLLSLVPAGLISLTTNGSGIGSVSHLILASISRGKAAVPKKAFVSVALRVMSRDQETTFQNVIRCL